MFFNNQPSHIEIRFAAIPTSLCLRFVTVAHFTIFKCAYLNGFRNKDVIVLYIFYENNKNIILKRFPGDP